VAPSRFGRISPDARQCAAAGELKIPAKTLRAARTAFAHHQHVKATVVVRVKDAAGNVTSKRLSIRLTG
jgi:hypothetical protein